MRVWRIFGRFNEKHKTKSEKNIFIYLFIYITYEIITTHLVLLSQKKIHQDPVLETDVQ